MHHSHHKSQSSLSHSHSQLLNPQNSYAPLQDIELTNLNSQVTSKNNQIRKNPKKKTTLCKNYLQAKFCPYKERCQFAHGISELQGIIGQTYRTKKCTSFVKNSFCKYGRRCNFLHKIQEGEVESKNNKIDGYRQIVYNFRAQENSKLLTILNKRSQSTKNFLK